ncbi:hypothetical protein NECAME_11796 [Necator americanus]|uniref:Uncharacterized protein n=1 Tax=Necator americanus TaxID=51031 RepID=W2T300_NECAM|nr:hypothetical protein NECAME_11796 [Necator americanus]ETN76258.1 hypothetical protein NECAME_11796 [Necator americanus]
MFEALREMELNTLAQLVDAQLTDPDFAKRMFRERFLNCELCARLDEYAGLLIERIGEFNALTFSDVYTTSPLEPPRQVPQLYEDIDPSQLLADGTVMSSPQHTEHNGPPSPEASKLTGLVGFDQKRMKVEVEEVLTGEYVVVAEEEVLDEVVEGPEAEELVEEAVLNGALGEMERINDRMVLADPSTSGDDIQNVESAESRRKARLKRMMQILREKVDSMADDETMELMETGLTNVVEQLGVPTRNTHMSIPHRPACMPRSISRGSSNSSVFDS